MVEMEYVLQEHTTNKRTLLCENIKKKMDYFSLAYENRNKNKLENSAIFLGVHLFKMFAKYL